jgi:hypothetical protein
MKLWHGTFAGVYLRGDAVIVASDKGSALRSLKSRVAKSATLMHNHGGKAVASCDVTELGPIDRAGTYVIDDGDY